MLSQPVSKGTPENHLLSRSYNKGDLCQESSKLGRKNLLRTYPYMGTGNAPAKCGPVADVAENLVAGYGL
jgi:hypothetical protein